MSNVSQSMKHVGSVAKSVFLRFGQHHPMIVRVCSWAFSPIAASGPWSSRHNLSWDWWFLNQPPTKGGIVQRQNFKKVLGMLKEDLQVWAPVSSFKFRGIEGQILLYGRRCHFLSVIFVLPCLHQKDRTEQQTNEQQTSSRLKRVLPKKRESCQTCMLLMKVHKTWDKSSSFPWRHVATLQKFSELGWSESHGLSCAWMARLAHKPPGQSDESVNLWPVYLHGVEEGLIPSMFVDSMSNSH